MSKVNYATLRASVNSAAAARHALGCKDFGVAEEDFLRATWQDLDRSDLLTWLGIAEPEGAVGPRPNAAVVARVVEQLGANPLEVLLFAEDYLARIVDRDVRDDLVEALCADTPAVASRLRPLLSGGRVFSALREAEVTSARGSHRAASSADRSCSAVSDLIPVRRDDRACLDRTRAALHGPCRASVLRLLVDAKLASEVGSLQVLVGDVPLLGTATDPTDAAELLAFAASWPEAEERRAFFVRRALAHCECSESWSRAYWETPLDLRDDIGLATAATEHPAPWSLAAVIRMTSGVAAWNLALKLVAHEVDPRSANGVIEAAAELDEILHRKTAAEDLSAALRDFPRSRHCQLALVAKLAVPPDADDRFDVDLANVFAEHPDLLLDRLLHLPRTRARAVRILDLAIKLGRLWRLDDVGELAELVGPLSGPVPLPLIPEHVPTFRVLVGPDRAEAELAQELRRCLDGQDIDGTLQIARLEPSLGSASRAEVRQLILATPISILSAIQRQDPWLLSEADVLAEASRRPEALGYIGLLPDYLAPVIEARAATTTNVAESMQLLTRLEQLGAKRDVLFGVVDERLKAQGPTAADPRWVGRRLGSRSAWDEHGPALLDAVMPRPTAVGAAMFIEIVLAVPRDEHSGDSVFRAIHTILGRFLIRHASSAFVENDNERARRALSALAHLSPRSGLHGSVAALGKLGKDTHRELIDLNASLLHRRNSEPATFAPIREALIAFLGDVAEEATS